MTNARWFAEFVRRYSRLMVMAPLALAACATSDLSTRSPELIVEGKEANYPAFEAAAKLCSYSAYRRFLGAKVEGVVEVGSHYNLFEIGTPAAGCVLRWIDAHPEMGLLVGNH